MQEFETAVAGREQRALQQHGADAMALPRLLDPERGFRLARHGAPIGRSSAAPRNVPSTKKP